MTVSFRGAIKYSGNIKLQILALLIITSAPCCAEEARCNVEGGYALNIAGTEAFWNITNYVDTPMTICEVSLSWPQSNGRLKRVLLDGEVIFSRGLDWSLEPFTISAWDGSPENRTLGQGKTGALRLCFDNDTKGTSESQYGIKIHFCECCDIEFQQGDVPMCNVLGGYNLGFGRREISWNLTNKGNGQITICRINMTWPGKNGRIVGAKLGDEEILSHEIEHPDGYAVIDRWDGSTADRSIGQGQTKALAVSFERGVSDGDPWQYGIAVDFCGGCSRELHPGYRACNISAGCLIIDKENRSAQLDITNWSNGPIGICNVSLNLSLNQSAKYAGLRRATLDDQEIFEGDVSLPGAVIPGIGGHWIGSTEWRTIGQGQTKKLGLYFENSTKGEDYITYIRSIRVDFCPCSIEVHPYQAPICKRPCPTCDYTIMPPEEPSCDIFGADRFCSNSIQIYVPIIYNVPDTNGSNYNWNVDSHAWATGDRFTLDGGLLQSGAHEIHLYLMDGNNNNICDCSKVVEIYPIPNFTIKVS